MVQIVAKAPHHDEEDQKTRRRVPFAQLVLHFEYPEFKKKKKRKKYPEFLRASNQNLKRSEKLYRLTEIQRLRRLKYKRTNLIY